MQPNLRHLIQLIQYHRKPRFAEIGLFLNQAFSDARDLDWDENILLDYLGKRKAELESSSLTKAGAIRAKSILLVEEIDELVRQAEVCLKSENFADYKDYQAHCLQTLDGAKRIFEEHGVGLSASYEFVDEFPEPFADRDYDAMNFDAADSTNFNVKAGVYFRKKALRPLYTSYLSLHECIHAILGDKDPDVMVSPLEEGLCELIGSIYLSSKLFSTPITENLFIYNRLGPAKGVLWDTYLSNTRLAASIYFEHGWGAIFSLIRDGRKSIALAEEQLFRTGALEPDFASSLKLRGTSFDFVETVRKVTTVLDDVYVCSPLAYYVARFLEPGSSVREIAAISDLTVEDVLDGVKELQRDFNVVTLRPDESVVVYSISRRLLSSPSRLRYSLRYSNE